MFKSIRKALDLVSEVRAEVNPTADQTTSMVSCGALECLYVGPHKHGHMCDFMCGCEKGQGTGDVVRG